MIKFFSTIFLAKDNFREARVFFKFSGEDLQIQGCASAWLET